ncbi:MAG: PilZ domain-containing protein [Deltaproteobacteria bacterium]|nr:PilZ domain-containing protein [Deltaproteobacteria bacterium]
MEEDQKYSGTMERRRSPRIEASILVKYIIYDNKGKALELGKGRTVNLSRHGILLETPKPLNGVFAMLMTIDLDGKDVKMKGRIVHSNMQEATGRYYSGIDFIGPEDQQVAAIVAFVKFYYLNKSKKAIPGLSNDSIVDPK